MREVCNKLINKTTLNSTWIDGKNSAWLSWIVASATQIKLLEIRSTRLKTKELPENDSLNNKFRKLRGKHLPAKETLAQRTKLSIKSCFRGSERYHRSEKSISFRDLLLKMLSLQQRQGMKPQNLTSRLRQSLRAVANRTILNKWKRREDPKRVVTSPVRRVTPRWPFKHWMLLPWQTIGYYWGTWGITRAIPSPI